MHLFKKNIYSKVDNKYKDVRDSKAVEEDGFVRWDLKLSLFTTFHGLLFLGPTKPVHRKVFLIPHNPWRIQTVKIIVL